MGRQSTIISYVVLLACGVVTTHAFFSEKGLAPEFPYATFGFVMLNGLLGTVLYARDTVDETMSRWLRTTQVFIKTLSLPCFATEIWLKYGVVQPEAAWGHAALGLLPACIYVFNDRLKREFIDSVVYICCGSLIAVAFMNANYLAILSALSFLSGYYVLRHDKHPMDIWPDVFFNYTTALFAAGAFLALAA